jgi:hypothetical protein
VEVPVDDPHENAAAMATGKEDIDAGDGNREDGGQEEQGLEEGEEVRHENEAAPDAVENLTTTRSGRVVRVPAYLRQDYEASNVQIGLTRANLVKV